MTILPIRNDKVTKKTRQRDAAENKQKTKPRSILPAGGATATWYYSSTAFQSCVLLQSVLTLDLDKLKSH